MFVTDAAASMMNGDDHVVTSGTSSADGLNGGSEGLNGGANSTNPFILGDGFDMKSSDDPFGAQATSGGAGLNPFTTNCLSSSEAGDSSLDGSDMINISAVRLYHTMYSSGFCLNFTTKGHQYLFLCVNRVRKGSLFQNLREILHFIGHKHFLKQKGLLRDSDLQNDTFFGKSENQH